MTAGEQRKQLEDSLKEEVGFGPPQASEPLQEVRAEEIRDLIRSRPPEEAGENHLWLRRVRVVGDLNLEAQKIRMRITFEQCELEGALDLTEAEAVTIRMTGCTVRGPISARQVKVKRNLSFEGLTTSESIFLAEATIGGYLSLVDLTMEAPSDGDEQAPVLNLDSARISGDIYAQGMTVKGETRFVGAAIAGFLSMKKAVLGLGAEGPSTGSAVMADGIRIDQSLNCEGIRVEGEFRIPRASVGAQTSFRDARLYGKKEEGEHGRALFADRAVLQGSTFFERIETRGEIHMVNARVDGLLVFDQARLNEGAENADNPKSALSADGLRVGSNILCRGDFRATGQIRLLGSTIGGSLWMDGATIDAGKGETAALGLDRAKIGEALRCKGLTATGEIRLHGVEVGGFASLDGATFRGKEHPDGTYGPSLNASRAHVAGTVHCSDVSATGEMRFIGAQIDGQLVLLDTRLTSPGKDSLVLVASQIDELLLALKEVEGTVDLRDAQVRSLFDAENGRFGGKLPERLRLEGFSYTSFRDPLDAAQRLQWIAPSQAAHHYPGVYTELANAFRRAGLAGDARKVAIANERRAHKSLPKRSHRRLWHDVLWLTIGYGYRNWLAAIWLVGLILVGALVFCIYQDSFHSTGLHPPSFNPILYSIDVTIPVLELGQSRSWSALGGMAWVGLVLAVSGYALAAAVIAAAAGLFARDQI